MIDLPSDRLSATVELTLNKLLSLSQGYLCKYASQGFKLGDYQAWKSCGESIDRILCACKDLKIDLDPVEISTSSRFDFSHRSASIKEITSTERILKASLKQGLETIMEMRVGSQDLLSALNMAYKDSRQRTKKVQKEARVFVGEVSGEDYFYLTPENQEVKQFVKSKQKSNLTKSDQAKGAPPTPADIKEKPGGKVLSTLNRFLLDSDEDDLDRVKQPGPREKPVD